MKNTSIWKEGIDNLPLSSLDQDITCDILIIGGGMAGLSTAYFLKETDMNIVLIDKNKCAEGASSKNTGKLTFMQELVYHKLESNYSEEIARLYFESQKDAIELATNIIKHNEIECDLFKEDAYVFINNERDKNKLEKEIQFYKNNNIEFEIIKEIPNKLPIISGIKTKESYSFNPYKFLIKIKNILKGKIKIYENTRAVEVIRENDIYIIKTHNDKKIKTKKLIIATQYPFFIIPGFTPFKTVVEKSFIVAGKNKFDKYQAINEGKPTFSFNYYNANGGYNLFSRRSHSVVNNLDTRNDKKEIIDEYKKYFCQAPDYYFQNHDLMTYDFMPFIGKIDNYNMYVLTGFNKWGNTNGIIGGSLISDLILKNNNKYEGIFNPKRGLSFLKIKNLAIYNTSVISRYILNKLVTGKNFYKDDVRIEYIEGKKCGIYTDKNGEHIVSNICPHMKCNLIFNYVDKTWDCPCHASRFDIYGNVIYGPSVYDIKVKLDKNIK